MFSLHKSDCVRLLSCEFVKHYLGSGIPKNLGNMHNYCNPQCNRNVVLWNFLNYQHDPQERQELQAYLQRNFQEGDLGRPRKRYELRRGGRDKRSSRVNVRMHARCLGLETKG